MGVEERDVGSEKRSVRGRDKKLGRDKKYLPYHRARTSLSSNLGGRIE